LDKIMRQNKGSEAPNVSLIANLIVHDSHRHGRVEAGHDSGHAISPRVWLPDHTAAFVQPYIRGRPGNSGGPSRATAAASWRCRTTLFNLTEMQKKPPSLAL
jgi:hypothetical protein